MTFSLYDVVSEKKSHVNWSQLTQSFASATTFHGIRYIAESTPYQSRRRVPDPLSTEVPIHRYWYLYGTLIVICIWRHMGLVELDYAIFRKIIIALTVTVGQESYMDYYSVHRGVMRIYYVITFPTIFTPPLPPHPHPPPPHPPPSPLVITM